MVDSKNLTSVKDQDISVDFSSLEEDLRVHFGENIFSGLES